MKLTQRTPEGVAHFLDQRYPGVWEKWELPVLEVTLLREGLELPDGFMNRALAAGVVRRHPTFWETWESFSAITSLLNGHPVSDSMDEHSVAEMLIAVEAATYLREHASPATPVPAFREEVLTYIAAMALHQDCWLLPAPLDVVNPVLAQPYYHCKDCGNEAPITVPDGHCDVCSKRFQASTVVGSLAPQTSRGTNLDYRVRNDQVPVARLLGDVLAGKEIGESAEASCVQRILLADSERQAHLRQRALEVR